VNTDSGELLAARFRLATPQPATPEAVITTIAEIVEKFNWRGPVGCGYPGVVKGGVTYTASNLANEWIGFNLAEALHARTSCDITALNDADAAGLAEMRFGAGCGQNGVVLIVTLGTGIGTALFVNGNLVPNLELGHIEMGGEDAEKQTSVAVREKAKLSWKLWGKRVNRYLVTMEELLWPDLIIVGGGVSKNPEKFFPYLTTRSPVVPAKMRNQAGVVGAALAVAP
jgi:polyphosphate glucokinase